MFTRKYWLAAIITLLLVTSLWVILTGISLTSIGACIISGACNTILGMIIGTLIFRSMCRLLGKATRFVSSLLSLTFGGGAGFILGSLAIGHIWDALFYGPHSEFYGGDIVYIFLASYSSLCTASAGLVFGLGPGQSSGEQRR